MKMPRVSKKHIIVLVALLVVIAAVLVVWLKVINKPDNQDQSQPELDTSRELTEEELVAEFDQFVEEANKSRQQAQAADEEIISGVDSLEDIQSLSDEVLVRISSQLIQREIAEGNTTKAYEYSQYLMQKDGAAGLEAAVLCYQVALDSTSKESCRARADELARAQGIIGQSEQLPDSYFAQSEGER